MRSGSALLSLMIGTVIASGVVIMLMTSLRQFISFDNLVMQETNYIRRLVVAQRQLERDILGVFVPLQATIKKEADQKKAEPKKPNPVDAKNNEKKEKKPLLDCFVLKKNDANGNLELLTFITSNVAASYWNKEVGKAQPKITRIVYTVEPDPSFKGAYRLMRQENSELNFKVYQKGGERTIRKFVLLDHISSIKVRCGYQEHKKEDKKTAAPNNPKEKEKKKSKKDTVDFKETSVWSDEMVQKKDTKLIFRIPDLIFIEYELFDEQYRSTTSHACTIPIISEGFNTAIKQEKAAPSPDEQNENPPNEAQAAGATGSAPTPTNPEAAGGNNTGATNFISDGLRAAGSGQGAGAVPFTLNTQNNTIGVVRRT